MHALNFVFIQIGRSQQMLIFSDQVSMYVNARVNLIFNLNMSLKINNL